MAFAKNYFYGHESLTQLLKRNALFFRIGIMCMLVGG